MANLPQKDSSAVKLTTPEQTPGAKKLFQTVRRVLIKPEAITANYDPTKERVGYTRFIVIDSVDGKTHIKVGASVQGGGINPIGLERHDFVEIMWWDESAGETGFVQYIDRRDDRAFSSKVISEPITQNHLEYLKEKGGGDYLPGGGGMRPAITEEQINNLAVKLETGHVNVSLTNALMKHLQTTWGASKVENSAPEKHNLQGPTLQG